MGILRSNKLLGLAFILLLIASVYFTYAGFTKQFADYDEVSLKTSKIGLQLPERADVKIRGVIVGEVLGFDATEEGALVEIGLYESQTENVPEDVTGLISPKTLFGEKFIDLQIPEGSGPETPAIEAGAVIEPTQVATEVEEVLADLQPLLTAVQPADLNMTLNALATALEGRGDQLGDNLETVDSYLTRLNPEIPDLVESLRLAGDVSDLYSDVVPQLARTLDDTVITTSTLEGREDRLRALFNDVSRFSTVTERFLDDNGDRLTRLSELSARQFRLLSRYSTEFPCLLQGIVNSETPLAEAFRGFTLHIMLEPLPRQPRGYTVADKPRIAEDRGPACLNLPNPPWDQENPLRVQPDFDDGVDEPTGKGTSRVAPRYLYRDGNGYAGSPMETEALKSLVAPGMGLPTGEVSDMAGLLLGPVARNGSVEMR